jgi:hypothetical protein
VFKVAQLSDIPYDRTVLKKSSEGMTLIKPKSIDHVLQFTRKNTEQSQVSYRYMNHFFVCIFVLILPLTGFAQRSQNEEEVLLSKPRGLYLGVRPGEQNYAPNKELKPTEGIQRIVWVGFQTRRNRAQVFVQTDAPPLFEIAESSPKTVIVDFPNARLHTRNESRELDVSYFPTVVRSIRARQVSRNLVRLVIRLRTPSRYRKKTDSKFLHLLFDPPKEPIDVIAEQEREAEQRSKSVDAIEYAPTPSL